MVSSTEEGWFLKEQTLNADILTEYISQTRSCTRDNKNIYYELWFSIVIRLLDLTQERVLKAHSPAYLV